MLMGLNDPDPAIAWLTFLAVKSGHRPDPVSSCCTEPPFGAGLFGRTVSSLRSFPQKISVTRPQPSVGKYRPLELKDEAAGLPGASIVDYFVTVASAKFAAGKTVRDHRALSVCYPVDLEIRHGRSWPPSSRILCPREIR